MKKSPFRSQARHATWVAASVLSLTISACGGGGSTSSEFDQVERSKKPAVSTDRNGAGTIFLSSAMNFQAAGPQHQLPGAVATNGSRTYGDFLGTGRMAAFVGTMTYVQDAVTDPALATPSKFAFWQRAQDGTWSEADASVFTPDSVAPCTVPRGSATADFNEDGRPDVFVACSGWTQAPWPGETNRIVLSQADGRYRVTVASAGSVAAHASASTADLNGDGHVDVLIMRNKDTPLVLLGDGQGGLTPEKGARVPELGHGYFVHQLVDVDGNGTLDLVVGGHELANATEPAFPTLVLPNDGYNRFIDTPRRVVPAATGLEQGVVMDILVTGDTPQTKALWLLRTSLKPGAEFYTGRAVQRLNWADTWGGYDTVMRSATNTATRLMTQYVGNAGHVVSDDSAVSAELLAEPKLAF